MKSLCARLKLGFYINQTEGTLLKVFNQGSDITRFMQNLEYGLERKPEAD